MTKNTTENPPEKMEAEEISSEHTYTLGPNAVDISPKQDQGVLKEIIEPGSGEESPCSGDKVFVHYTGKLEDGTVFDSSRDRDVFEFTLGKGEVIKAWDIGVATMKKNEKCVLVCKSEYAYGANGSPPKIPPNATLIFEVELLRWQLEDLSPDKDGGILKSIFQAGEGYLKPNDDSNVEVHLIGKYNDAVFEERDVKFSLDEASEYGITAGLEIAIKSLKKNERAQIQLTSKYAFGNEGKAEFNIPPGANIEYEVTLKAFENPKETWNMNSEEKLEQSDIVKNKGTNYFKSGKYDIALKFYQKIITYLEHESDLDDQKDQQKKSLMLASYLNSAACNLKLGNYSEVVKNCGSALQIDPQNVKGLFRRGQARMGVQEFDAAKVEFRSVIDIDPSNKAAKQQIAMCNAKIKQILEKEKRTYRNMFEKFAEEDAKKIQQNGDDSGNKKEDENEEVDIETTEEPGSTVEA